MINGQRSMSKWFWLAAVAVMVGVLVGAHRSSRTVRRHRKAVPAFREILSRQWITQIYNREPELTVTQKRAASNNRLPATLIPECGSLSLLALGSIFLLWRKRGAV